MTDTDTTTIDARRTAAAAVMGSARTERKAAASRENGKRGGYWTHVKRRDKPVAMVTREAVARACEARDQVRENK